MSANLHAEALALIAERRALLAAGTPGPWENSNDHLSAPLHRGSRIAVRIASVFPTGNGPRPNTPLIVAAVNDYGPLLDLAEHVLNAHAPTLYDWYICGCQDQGYDPPESPGVCSWPCPDATAALRSLGLVTT